MHRILMMFVGLLCLSMGVAYAQDDASAELKALLAEYAPDDGAAMVALISTPDETVAAAVGLADGVRPAQVGDRFRLASMSKTYVAALALKLTEEGVLRLDEVVAPYLPADVVANIANADEVTLRQLLAMRSGIPDYLEQDAFWEALQAEPTRPWTAEAAITYAYGLPAEFAPDAAYRYSNSNYLLVQLALEQATGASIAALMRRELLEPLGLEDTYTERAESLPGGIVDGFGYWTSEDVIENISGIDDGMGLADGGLAATASDVARFYRALLAEQSVLGAASMAELLRFSDDGEGAGYSLGLEAWETEYGTAWGHSGAVTGFLSQGAYLVEADTVIVVLAASEDADMDAVEAMMAWWFD